MLYAASAMYPHHPHLGPPSVPSPHRRRPQPFPPSPDPPSPTLPGVSALLRARPASAAGPRKRSLGPSADEDAGPDPSPARWDGGRSRAHSVYMQLAGPPPPHPLRPHPPPHPQSAGGPWAGARFPPLGPRLVDPASVRSPVGGLGVGLSALGMAGPSAAASASTPVGLASPPGGPKASRYLREMDRRVILARIARGEKQSALAKEFQVSRAAICNLYKHRDEVLSRRGGNPLAKHPKKPRPKAGSASSTSAAAAASVKAEPARAAAAAGPVHELRSRAAALLLTALRREQTDARAFRRSAARLVRLVLEEALALAPLAAVDVALGGGGRADGVALERPPCAVSLAAAGGQMLAAFADMEPEQPAGRVRFEDEREHEHGAARLEGPALPPTLTHHSVLLLEPVADSPSRACAAVRSLLARGAAEASVSLVALVVARPVVDALRAAFPALTVVAAQVEEREMDQGDALRRRLASARESESESESEW